MKTEDNTTNREMDLMKSAWPPKDIVSKLIEAADILLHKKDYDGHGWEEIEYCFRMAKEWFESSQSQPQPTKIDEGELAETLRFALSQLESYHKIANDPGTTDCSLKIKAIAKLINGGNE